MKLCGFFMTILSRPRFIPLAALLLFGAAVAGADAPATVSATCAACHGADGNSRDPAYPKLAGMDQEYLLRQLKAFASGKRKDETMSPVVESLDPSEFAALVAHFSRQKPEPGRQRKPDLAAAGKKVYEDGNSDSGVPACAGCHQPDGRGNARFPRLAGQHPDYLLKQLMAYKSGRRATDPLMITVGQRLAPEEMRAVVEYIAGLGSE
ncbi:MAG: hypothetical protein RIR00_1386 [Pseudomonadota bacterium]